MNYSFKVLRYMINLKKEKNRKYILLLNKHNVIFITFKFYFLNKCSFIICIIHVLNLYV